MTRGRGLTALYASVNAFLLTGLVAAIAIATGNPLVFPSLGPTAFLLFATPMQPTACPRNTVLGHLIGVLSGAIGLISFDQLTVPPDLTHVTWARAGAAALALSLTCGAMILFALPHPPAGATTLIVALGLLRTPVHMAVIMAGVVLLTVAGGCVNRLARIPYPVWTPVSAPLATPEGARRGPGQSGIRSPGSKREE